VVFKGEQGELFPANIKNEIEIRIRNALGRIGFIQGFYHPIGDTYSRTGGIITLSCPKTEQSKRFFLVLINDEKEEIDDE